MLLPLFMPSLRQLPTAIAFLAEESVSQRDTPSCEGGDKTVDYEKNKQKILIIIQIFHFSSSFSYYKMENKNGNITITQLK